MLSKNVIVTGGSKGIGNAIVQKLINEGYTVIIFDISNSSNDKADFIKCDISKEEDVIQSFEKVISKYKHIYGVVNNAGIISDKVIWKMSVDEFEKVININLKGTWLMCRESAKIMRNQNYGRIVNISSRAWLGNPGQTNYSASKAGIIGLSRSLALELGKYNVSVNVVAPGLIETELTKSLPNEVFQKLLNLQPQNNIGNPDDVANVVSFLLNENTQFINGQLIYVDGGRSIGQGI
ncbi:MAG TPA: SDR family NAD(P)-dependent oxidoreductase [Bacteroidia bacterium]|nr:SDR family NAD(P)-dependent oxidoreductase [Bacteroidia bacterium]